MMQETTNLPQDISLQWLPSANLTRANKTLLYLAVFLTLAWMGVETYLYTQTQWHLPPFHLILLLPGGIAWLRLSDYWPFSAGNFIYFRAGKLLFSVGNTRFSLQQGSIHFSDLEAVSILSSSIILRTKTEKFQFSSKAIPSKQLRIVHLKLAQELRKYETVHITKFVNKS